MITTINNPKFLMPNDTINQAVLKVCRLTFDAKNSYDVPLRFREIFIVVFT